MSPALIGWIVSLILWCAFTILNIIGRSKENTALIIFSLDGMLISLGFIWIFMGFIHNWW